MKLFKHFTTMMYRYRIYVKDHETDEWVYYAILHAANDYQFEQEKQRKYPELSNETVKIITNQDRLRTKYETE